MAGSSSKSRRGSHRRWGNSEMKLILITIAITALISHADDRIGQAMEYHFQGSNTYFVISTTETRAFLDLRTYDADKVVQSVVLSSRYMPAHFEAKDVASDDGLEFLVQTRDGGTGIAETHEKVYGLYNSNIRLLGDFVIEHQSESWPEPTHRQIIKGNVTFPAKNRLNYSYTKVLTENGITTTNIVVEAYIFNNNSGRFEKTKGPNQAMHQRPPVDK